MRFNYNTHLRTNDLHKYLHLFDRSEITSVVRAVKESYEDDVEFQKQMVPIWRVFIHFIEICLLLL